MHHLIYLSRASQPFTETQLQDLLADSRRANTQQNLSGILLYGNNQFLQVLEGEESAVRAAYARIGRDPRHQNLTVFADKTIEQRAFADWHMAYQPLDPQTLLDTLGYVAPGQLQLARPDLSQVDTQLVQLLRSFVLPETPS
jgi:hypothetical protein